MGERSEGGRVDLFGGHRRNDADHVFPDLGYILEELDLQGYCILPGQMSAAELEACRGDVDAQLARQEDSFGRENLRRINDAGVVRSPFLSSALIREQCLAGRVRAIADRVFRDRYILNLNRAAVSRPDDRHPAAIWHRDSSYVNFTSSRILSLSFLHLIDGSCADNGGVALLPGSHRWELFPSDEFARRNAVIPEIPSGAILVFDSSLFHCGTTNRSAETRRSLLTVYTTPLYKQQVNFPQMIRDMGCEAIVDAIPEGRFLLGFDTEVCNSDDLYRRKKLAICADET